MRLVDAKQFRTMGLIYAVVDIICIGLGMGVPVLCIFLGFVVGWFVVGQLSKEAMALHRLFHKTLKYSLLSVTFTFAIMLVIWGRMFLLVFDPNVDYANLGIPLILYDPKLSLMGWLILMIFVSPALQLLTTIFAAYITIQRKILRSA
ncbi:MAG: hypothetical protein JSV98_02790 [candidate division WOR-3 bacterium]|nr:MAG: hypothetical protein JSV98_02790 [candidate division WOR-3 bacterium]